MRNEKELLTREIIFQKLIREAKRTIIGSILILFLGSLVFGMLYLVLSLANPPAPFFVFVIEGILVTAFIFVCVLYMIRGILQLSKAGRGDFTIIEDVLSKVEDNQFNLWRMLITGRVFVKRNFEHVFQFKSGKQFVANSDEYRNTHLDTAAKFSLPGDTFFIVYYNDQPEKIVLLFSAKIYDYKGN